MTFMNALIPELERQTRTLSDSTREGRRRFADDHRDRIVAKRRESPLQAVAKKHSTAIPTQSPQYASR